MRLRINWRRWWEGVGRPSIPTPPSHRITIHFYHNRYRFEMKKPYGARPIVCHSPTDCMFILLSFFFGWPLKWMRNGKWGTQNIFVIDIVCNSTIKNEPRWEKKDKKKSTCCLRRTKWLSDINRTNQNMQMLPMEATTKRTAKAEHVLIEIEMTATPAKTVQIDRSDR